MSKKKGDKNDKKGAKLDRKTFDKELKKLQTELVKLQEWVKHEGLRVVVVFEGRDAAGKGGIIKRIMERVSPRVFRVVALPAPSDREKTQFYYQRYLTHLPAAGEVVLFDRSWYNRAGVERVMDFCTDKQYVQFMQTCPGWERALVESGIILIKYWLTVDNEEQEKRFQERIEDPRKHWKLSPMDVEARSKWYDYARARDAMFDATDTDVGTVVCRRLQRPAAGKAQLHLTPAEPDSLRGSAATSRAELPPRGKKDAYDDEAALETRTWVPEKY